MTHILSVDYLAISPSHLTATVADPVDHHAGEHRETLEDFEEAGGGEEIGHGWCSVSMFSGSQVSPQLTTYIWLEQGLRR